MLICRYAFDGCKAYHVCILLTLLLLCGFCYYLFLQSSSKPKNDYISLRSDGSRGNRVGFASQLRLLIDALDMSFHAQFMEDFVSGLN